MPFWQFWSSFGGLRGLWSGCVSAFAPFHGGSNDNIGGCGWLPRLEIVLQKEQTSVVNTVYRQCKKWSAVLLTPANSLSQVSQVFIAGINTTALTFFPCVVLRIICEFFIESLPDTCRKERQGMGQGERQRKRNMGCCMLLSVVHSPTTIPSLLSCASFHLPAAMVIRTRGTGESPPPYTHTSLDGLRLQQWFSRVASNLKVVSTKTDIGQW